MISNIFDACLSYSVSDGFGTIGTWNFNQPLTGWIKSASGLYGAFFWAKSYLSSPKAFVSYIVVSASVSRGFSPSPLSLPLKSGIGSLKSCEIVSLLSSMFFFSDSSGNLGGLSSGIDKIVTSLPYNIIEPFTKKLINTNFKELYMLIGSNYVDDVLNNNINKLSIITNSYFNLTKLLEVLPSSFDIPPHTLSYVVKLEKKDFHSLSDIYKIYNLLYYYQDKKIKNSLKESLIKINNLTQKEAKKIISNLNIPESILETKFEIISNEELKVLNKYLLNIMI